MDSRHRMLISIFHLYSLCQVPGVDLKTAHSQPLWQRFATRSSRRKNTNNDLGDQFSRSSSLQCQGQMLNGKLRWVPLYWQTAREQRKIWSCQIYRIVILLCFVNEDLICLMSEFSLFEGSASFSVSEWHELSTGGVVVHRWYGHISYLFEGITMFRHRL